MTALTVVAPGPLTTVQDLGRPGLAHLGVGRSGAADLASLRRAQRLVGNVSTAAALETVLGGLRLRTDVGVLIAATGTSAALRIDGRTHTTGEPVWWPAGTELVVEAPRAGLRTYLAVRGGIAVAPVLGSRSTDTLSGLGPARLRPGDVVRVGDEVDGEARREAVPELGHGAGPTLDVGPGPRAPWFDLAVLLAGAWEVSVASDRVGVRLLGPPLERHLEGELPSEGLVRGAVQVPADGVPLVFGADHPTTGGYPVVAVLTDAASDRLAQARPGTVVRFRSRGSRDHRAGSG